MKKECSVSGVGLHTGCEVDVTFKSADVNTGISFVRVDCPGPPVIPADFRHVLRNGALPRCTSIFKDKVVVHTVEHLMGVLCGLGITNIIIELNAPEVPGLDGSGIDFLRLIKKTGILDQSDEASAYSIREPIGVSHNISSIFVVPSDKFKISYTLDYEHALLKSQFVHFEINNKTFEDDIAPCRTFCLEDEAKELLSRGLGKGASTDNALIVGKDGVKDNKTIFPDEFARHKVLDFIGDLYLLGVPVLGHVFATKSGHSLNLELLKEISNQKDKYEASGKQIYFDYSGRKELDISRIMNIIPHRYPFLLVDRVVEIDAGKKAAGIKNVTVNDNFFQGHFPGRPVMPGVLMVEAMAQTAGVLILSRREHHGKMPFFVSIDKAKFRKVVVPGDQLIMEVSVAKEKSRFAQIRGISKVCDNVVAEADMMFTYAQV